LPQVSFVSLILPRLIFSDPMDTSQLLRGGDLFLLPQRISITPSGRPFVLVIRRLGALGFFEVSIIRLEEIREEACSQHFGDHHQFVDVFLKTVFALFRVAAFGGLEHFAVGKFGETLVLLALAQRGAELLMQVLEVAIGLEDFPRFFAQTNFQAENGVGEELVLPRFESRNEYQVRDGFFEGKVLPLVGQIPHRLEAFRLRSRDLLFFLFFAKLDSGALIGGIAILHGGTAGAPVDVAQLAAQIVAARTAASAVVTV